MNGEDDTYVLTHPDHGTIRNVRVSQDAREQTGVELPLSISGFAHWQDAVYLRAMGWTITATQSPATVPGDNDELTRHEANVTENISRGYPRVKYLDNASTLRLIETLRTEQRARQAAEEIVALQKAVILEYGEERDALQQRIDAGLAEHRPVPWHEVSDGTSGIACSVCDSEQYPCPTVAALTAPTERREPELVREPSCVEAWPECRNGDYNPACCRFPKSCSVQIVPAESKTPTPEPTRNSSTERES